MTSSPETLLKSTRSLDDVELSEAEISYINALAQDEAYEEVVSLFMRMAAEQGITKAFVARRLGKKPEQITRWLCGPGNWTLETYSSPSLALGHKPRFGKERLRELRPTNEHHHAVAIGIESFEAGPVADLDDIEAAIRKLIGTDLA